jgi:hypothetical protein
MVERTRRQGRRLRGHEFSIAFVPEAVRVLQGPENIRAKASCRHDRKKISGRLELARRRGLRNQSLTFHQGPVVPEADSDSRFMIIMTAGRVHE